MVVRTTVAACLAFVLFSAVAATPAIVGDRIYLRGRQHLYCLAEKDGS